MIFWAKYHQKTRIYLAYIIVYFGDKNRIFWSKIHYNIRQNYWFFGVYYSGFWGQKLDFCLKTHYNIGQICWFFGLYYWGQKSISATYIVYFWYKKQVKIVNFCSKYQWKSWSNFFEIKVDNISIKKRNKIPWNHDYMILHFVKNSPNFKWQIHKLM